MSGATGIAVTVIVLAATAALTLAVAGVVRIPDSYVKAHAASKAVILGPVLVLSATLFLGQADLVLRAVLVGAFLVITAPVAGHAVVRFEKRRQERLDGEPPQGRSS